MIPGVTAVIPSIPPRAQYLSRALNSVTCQTFPVNAISVAIDTDHEGADRTRNRALSAVKTRWVAFLDDDDEWLSNHINVLMRSARETDADVIYPWFRVISRGKQANDPLLAFGKPFDSEELKRRNYIPVTVLAKTELILDVGGFEALSSRNSACDDWGLWKKLLDRGARFHHTPQRTWLWHWHGKNTSGLSDRW